MHYNKTNSSTLYLQSTLDFILPSQHAMRAALVMTIISISGPSWERLKNLLQVTQ